MEHLWIKPSHKGEKEALNKIGAEASKNMDSAVDTSVKEVLDEETQQYIEDRFPKTNDDMLQNDLAQKFILDTEYLNKLHHNNDKGEKIQKETIEEVWKMYAKQMEVGAYIDVYVDVNKKVRKLINDLNILNLKKEIAEKFPMAKSGISNNEAFSIAKTEAENIKKELDTIKDEGITKESIGELLDKYKKVSENFDNVRNSIEPDHPELN